METNTRYIVTKGSDDGTFEEGDHIMLHKDGSIICKEAQGWIDKDDVEEAMKGVDYQVDWEYYEHLYKQHKETLEELENILKHKP